MTNLKVLVFGGIEEGLCRALEKANTIHKGKNGPFSMLLLLGDVFEKASEEDVEKIMGGVFTVELPTYFFYRPGTTPERISNTLEDGYGEICGNLTCLGASGRFETTEGLKIGYDFVHQNNSFTGDPVDILVTGDWPEGIEAETDAKFKAIEKSDSVRQSVLQLRPNYHFVTRLETFWERQPFRWSEEDTHITRFICLSQFGGSKKWFYAFNISTDRKQAAAVPVGTTSNPLENIQEEQSIIWDKGVKRGYVGDTNGPPNSKRRQQRIVQPDSCFFCLSNPNVDRDLIVSIAEESYLALAKGPMKLGSKKLPHHLIFIPLAHVPTPFHLEVEPSNAVALEKEKYIVALNSMYEELEMTCISFEISRNRGVHFHTQILAVPKDKLDTIESAFMTQAEQFGFPIMKRPLDKDENEYFKVGLPNDESLVVELNNTFRFDLQFGRKVLANALDIPEQVDWKSCSQSKKEEQTDAQKFKQAFKTYDFTI
jgi:hypothetical protein